AVNCQMPLSARPEAEPCGACDACTSFDDGRAMNVIEIDAASHNGVDDMRELRETVRIPPQGAKKKVYILDEVHMLSASAFNAILKTLEEPPEHALFIFATTEPHKVLPTILSRTQRFDFRRIAVPEIVEQLRTICREETITADDDALVLVARRGDGAMRDALSVFDQAVALCGTNLVGTALRAALGVVEEDLLFETADRASAGDRAGLLRLLDGVVRRGHDLREFLLGLADHVRNLLAARATGDGSLVEGTDAGRARTVAAAQAWAEADLLHLLLIVDEAIGALRASAQPRLTVELALLRMASLEKAADLQRLLAHLDALARAGGPLDPRAAGSAAPLVAAPLAAPAVATAAPSVLATGGALPVSAVPPATAPINRPAPPAAPAPTVSSEPPETYAAPPRAETSRAETSRAMPPDEAASTGAPPTHADVPPPHGDLRAHPVAPQAEPPRPDPSPSDRSFPGDVPPDGGVTAPDERPTPPPAPHPVAPRPDAPVPRPGGSLFGPPAIRPRGPGGPSGDGHSGAAPTLGGPAVADPFTSSLGRIRELWPALAVALRAEQRIRLASFLGGADVVRVYNGAVEVALSDALAVAVATEHAAEVQAALSTLLGEAAPPLRFVRAEAARGREPAQAADPFERLKAMRHEHPVVRALFERFGAEIVWQ
ncbi:MAG TPA: DNA polymerase III subunit gamma/tau, partial [Rubricoccaceae bacterium]